jgi:hypothetical protein
MTRGSALSALILLVLVGCRPPEEEVVGRSRLVDPEEIVPIPTEARFFSVRDVALSGDALWVLEGAPPFVTRVSLVRGEVVEFGGEGEGPSELRNPWGIQPAVGPGAAGVRIWDLGNGRVSTFDPAGDLMGSEPLSTRGIIRARNDIREVSYTDPFRIRSGPSGVFVGVFPERVNRTPDLSGGSLWRADVRLEPDAEVARFGDHVPSGSDGLREWTAVPLWDACDGSVVLWSPGASRVIWLDAQGRVTHSAPVEVEQAPLDLQDIERYLRQMSRLELGPDHEEAGINFAGVARSMRRQFAEDRPFATDLRCQEGEAAWIRLFDTSLDPVGRSQEWLRVSPENPPLGVTFPTGFTPVLFTSNRVYGLLETPTGDQRLAWWSEVTDG